MADKEFVLGVRAKELLKYTKQVTRIVTDDVSQRDVRKIIGKIAALDDIRLVKMVCEQTVGQLDKEKVGFTKGTFRLYGSDMRDIAKQIMFDVRAANTTYFMTNYEQRLQQIESVVNNCVHLLDYITVCLEEGIISKERCATWTAKVEEVHRIATTWLKNDRARAVGLRELNDTAKSSKLTAAIVQALTQYDAMKHQ